MRCFHPHPSRSYLDSLPIWFIFLPLPFLIELPHFLESPSFQAILYAIGRKSFFSSRNQRLIIWLITRNQGCLNFVFYTKSRTKLRFFLNRNPICVFFDNRAVKQS